MYAGIELDIDSDGIPFINDERLKVLDYAILSIHRSIGENVVKRYISAINRLPSIPKIIGHLTGKLFPHREVPEDNWILLFTKCAQTNTLIEINGQADRLDPPMELIRIARNAGCKFILASDAHGDINPKILESAWYHARISRLRDKDLVCTSDEVQKWIQLTSRK